MSEPAPIHISGDYVIIPRAEYLRLCGGLSLAETKEALRAEIARGLRLAREHAGLSQRQLATKLGVTQPMVSKAEAGSARVSGAYMQRVLKACKLPADWVPPEGSESESTGVTSVPGFEQVERLRPGASGAKRATGGATRRSTGVGST